MPDNLAVIRFFFVATAILLLTVSCSSQSKRIEQLSASPEASGATANGSTIEDVRVIDSGFVWDEETLSYAFTAENTSTSTSLEGTVVQVSIYGKAGEAIGSDSGIVDFFLPGQIIAFAGRVPLTDEPERIALAFAVEKTARVEGARPIEVATGKYSETNFGGRVVTVIDNPYDRDLRRLNVVAVLRNEEGKILNGGSAVLELLPARGESSVTIDILGAPPQEPASIDVYTNFSAETVFRLE